MIDDRAFGTMAALTAITARIHTLAVDARVCTWADQIVAATNATQTILAYLSIATGRVGVTNRSANALHAFLVGQTVLVGVADGLAGVAVTVVVWRTIAVVHAYGRWIFAAEASITHQRRRTFAHFHVIADAAERVGATGRWSGAWIHTLLVYAAQLLRTIGVGATAGAADEILAQLAIATIVVTSADRFA